MSPVMYCVSKLFLTFTIYIIEKKLDSNFTRLLRVILNKSWRQHPTKQLLYGHLRPITKTIQVRRTSHAGHCWRSGDELIANVLQWTPSHGRVKAGWPARSYIQQLCDDTGCSLEELTEAMDNRERWRERVRDIRADGATWWWLWWSYIYYLYYGWQVRTSLIVKFNCLFLISSKTQTNLCWNDSVITRYSSRRGLL